MPMYDYRCERCAAQFEVRQSFNDDTLTLCPSEGGPTSCTAPGEGAVKKVFSGVAISFKGDGFYKNDHGANAGRRRSERETEPSKDTSSDTSSSSSNGSSPSKESPAAESSSDSGSGSGSESKASKAEAGTSSSSAAG